MVYGFKYAVVFGTQMTFILTGYTVGYTCINRYQFIGFRHKTAKN